MGFQKTGPNFSIQMLEFIKRTTTMLGTYKIEIVNLSFLFQKGAQTH